MWFWGRKSRGVDRDRRNVSCCVMRCDCVRESQVTSHGSPAGVCQMAGRSSSSAIHAFFNEGLCARYIGSTERGKRNKHKNPTRVTEREGRVVVVVHWIGFQRFFFIETHGSIVHITCPGLCEILSNQIADYKYTKYYIFFCFRKKRAKWVK